MMDNRIKTNKKQKPSRKKEKRYNKTTKGTKGGRTMCAGFKRLFKPDAEVSAGRLRGAAGRTAGPLKNWKIPGNAGSWGRGR